MALTAVDVALNKETVMSRVEKDVSEFKMDACGLISPTIDDAWEADEDGKGDGLRVVRSRL